jgi:hypothetical protein
MMASDDEARNSNDDPRSWKEALADRVWARWRWLLVAVLVLFALNNMAGFVAGAVGVIALANRAAARVLKARRVVEQVRRVVAEPADPTDAERSSD